MKGLASILIMLCVPYFAHNIKAQYANDNYLSPINVWAVVADNLKQTGADTEITYCYTWGQDSIINGITYREVTLGFENPHRFLDMKYYKRYYSLLYYREEGKKIFRFDSVLGKDVLLYDFGVSVGDEITILDGKRVRVSKEFSADELENYCYSYFTKDGPPKAWRICGVDDNTYEDIWIDGAGSLYTGILLRSDFPEDVSLTTVFNPSIYLSRYTQYDKIQPVQLSNYWDAHSYDEYSEKEYYMNIEFVDDTLRINAFQKFVPSAHVFRCHLDGNDVFVSAIPVDPSCSLSEGHLYSEYEVKFPGFEAETYTIKIDRETMGDLSWCDPPQYWKEVTITCNGPATGIQETNSSIIQNNKESLYDLSGRRLNQQPQRGIYIQNGKKYIVR